MVAEVVLNNNSRHTDRLYHYRIPPDLEGKVQVGCRVAVPFGKGNKTYEAYVLRILETSEFKTLKELAPGKEDTSYFNEAMAGLISFVRHRYFSPYRDIIRAVLPKGAEAKYETVLTLSGADESAVKAAVKHSAVKEKILEVIQNAGGEITMTSLCAAVSRKTVPQAVKALCEAGVLTRTQKRLSGVREKTQRLATLLITRAEAYALSEQMAARAPARARVLETLCESEMVGLSELLEVCQTSLETVKALALKDYVELVESTVEPEGIYGALETAPPRKLTLSNEQQAAYDAIFGSMQQKKQETFLVHGVTGSGKTELYLRLMRDCVDAGNQAILLVPEIALTPQMIRQVVGVFGDGVAVMHSRLTLRQRYDEWQRIKSGAARVVVGARSAIFAPVTSLGLIIIDEEHETTYKSETHPRYQTVELARYRAKFEGATLVLASATPSLESYYHAKSGKYKLIELKKRVNQAALPTVQIVDMREELKSGNHSLFSGVLQEAIKRNLEQKKKTILFLNKRGYASFVSCRSCGYVAKCPNCSIALTYHKAGNCMVCHYCDYKEAPQTVCPSCKSPHIRQFGVGTQRVVDALVEMFPTAKILRMDADTTASRRAHEKILEEFAQNGADILVGTQMIAKGLDIPSVTLVGVLAADLSLFLDDFRAGEKTFSLITQVVGRAGRGDCGGNAVIQTYYPENEVLHFSQNQDYAGFYHSEIEMRKALCYPPFCEMIHIVATAADESAAQMLIQSVRESVIQAIKRIEYKGFVKIYNVSKAPIFLINNQYRYRFLMKLRYSKTLFDALHTVWHSHIKDGVSLVIDVNPVSFY